MGSGTAPSLVVWAAAALGLAGRPPVREADASDEEANHVQR